MFNPEMQAAFNEIQDAIDVALTNGLLSENASAMWDALCESMDDEKRLTEAYELAKVELAKEAEDHAI